MSLAYTAHSGGGTVERNLLLRLKNNKAAMRPFTSSNKVLAWVINKIVVADCRTATQYALLIIKDGFFENLDIQHDQVEFSCS